MAAQPDPSRSLEPSVNGEKEAVPNTAPEGIPSANVERDSVKRGSDLTPGSPRQEQDWTPNRAGVGRQDNSWRGRPLQQQWGNRGSRPQAFSAQVKPPDHRENSNDPEKKRSVSFDPANRAEGQQGGQPPSGAQQQPLRAPQQQGSAVRRPSSWSLLKDRLPNELRGLSPQGPRFPAPPNMNPGEGQMSYNGSRGYMQSGPPTPVPGKNPDMINGRPPSAGSYTLSQSRPDSRTSPGPGPGQPGLDYRSVQRPASGERTSPYLQRTDSSLRSPNPEMRSPSPNPMSRPGSGPRTPTPRIGDDDDDVVAGDPRSRASTPANQSRPPSGPPSLAAGRGVPPPTRPQSGSPQPQPPQTPLRREPSQSGSSDGRTTPTVGEPADSRPGSARIAARGASPAGSTQPPPGRQASLSSLLEEEAKARETVDSGSGRPVTPNPVEQNVPTAKTPEPPEAPEKPPDKELPRSRPESRQESRPESRHESKPESRPESRAKTPQDTRPGDPRPESRASLSSSATKSSKPQSASSTYSARESDSPKRPSSFKKSPDSAVREAVKENNIEESAKKKAEPVTNGTHASPSKSPGKVAAPKKLGTMPSPLKSPNKPTTKTPETPSTAEKKKVPMNKIQVGAAPSPNLKTIKSKIGSLDNTSYKPGGGKIKIESRKLDFSKTQPKIEAKNPVYTPGGGDKKIQQVKLQWNAKPKVGSLDNAAHKPGGGDKKIESVKLDFKEKAKPKVGSKDNIKHVAGGGSVKNSDDSQDENPDIEDQKLDIKAQSKIGSLDNLKHKPGGGEKKIFDDKDYLRQMSGLANEGQSSGTQGSSRRETPVHSRTKSSESKSPGEIYKSKEELRESSSNKTKSREELRESTHERIRSRDDVHNLASDRIKPTDQNSNQLPSRPEYPTSRPKEPTRKVLLNNTEDNIVKVTKEESWNRINESQPQQKTTQEERVRILDSQPLTRNDERHQFPESKPKVTIEEKAKTSESPMPPRVIPEERSRVENQAQQRTPVEENRHRIQENQRLPSGNSPQEKSSMQQPLQYSLGAPVKLNDTSSNPSMQQSANEEVLQRTPNENEIYQMPKKEMGAHSAGRGGSNPQARTPYSMYGSMHVDRPGASPEVGYYSSRLRDSNDNQHISNRAEPPPMHRVQDGNYRVLD